MTESLPQVKPRLIEWNEFDRPTLVLNIGKSISDYKKHLPHDYPLTSAHFMGFVQRAWRLNANRANNVELILAVDKTSEIGRVILGAFVFGRTDNNENGSHGDKFIQSDYDDAGRYTFLAEPADPSTWQKYVGNFIPATKPGEANPVRYIDA